MFRFSLATANKLSDMHLQDSYMTFLVMSVTFVGISVTFVCISVMFVCL